MVLKSTRWRSAASIWFTFYYFLVDGLPGGQSLGKRMQGMTVMDADSGMPCSFRQSFIRSLLLALLGPFDWLFIFGERHQRLGDKAAGTIVLNTDSLLLPTIYSTIHMASIVTAAWLIAAATTVLWLYLAFRALAAHERIAHATEQLCIILVEQEARRSKKE